MSRLLLLEDDISLIDGLQYSLEKNGFEIEVVRTVKDAEKLLKPGTQTATDKQAVKGKPIATEKQIAGEQNSGFDLLILDVTLPDGTGFEVCEQVRKSGNMVPIIFLTAADEETNIIRGLDSGGDDYITKPFKLGELCSRIHALLRRSRQASGWNNVGIAANDEIQINDGLAGSSQKANGNRMSSNDKVSCGLFEIDMPNCRVSKDGRELELTVAEYRLLCLLIRNANRIMTRQVILDALWDGNGDFVDDNTLSVYIRRLREKVEENPSAPKYLQTVRGFGYRWNEVDQ